MGELLAPSSTHLGWWCLSSNYQAIFSIVGFSTFPLSKTGFAPGSREWMVPGMAGSIGYRWLNVIAFIAMFYLRVHIFVQREAPLWAAASLWSSPCKPLQRDGRQTFFNYCIRGTIGTSLSPSLPPSLSLLLSRARRIREVACTAAA